MHRLTPLGELDIATVAELREEFETVFGDGDAEMIVVDLTELTFIDSTGLRLLFEMNEVCEHADRLRVVNGSAAVVRTVRPHRRTPLPADHLKRRRSARAAPTGGPNMTAMTARLVDSAGWVFFDVFACDAAVGAYVAMWLREQIPMAIIQSAPDERPSGDHALPHRLRCRAQLPGRASVRALLECALAENTSPTSQSTRARIEFASTQADAAAA